MSHNLRDEPLAARELETLREAALAYADAYNRELCDFQDALRKTLEPFVTEPVIVVYLPRLSHFELSCSVETADAWVEKRS